MNLAKDDKLFSSLIAGGLTSNTFDINKDLMTDISDWAGEMLQKTGFDKNYELTKAGALLEELIDILHN